MILLRTQIVEGEDRPKQLGPKIHSELGRTIGLMLLFSAGKAVVIDSGFCVANFIFALAAKGVDAGALIKKRRYWPKTIPGDLIDQHFLDKELGDIDTLEASTEDGNPFHILCFKENDYVTNIMTQWMTLDGLEGSNTKQKYKVRDGESLVKNVKYWHPLGLHFHYRHQVDNHNNRRHSTISPERTRATKFCTDHKFAWYLAVTEVNTALASGHFQNGGNIMPTLAFWRQFAI